MHHTSKARLPATSQPAGQRTAKPGKGKLAAQLASSPRQAAQHHQLDDLRTDRIQRTESRPINDAAALPVLANETVQRMQEEATTASPPKTAIPIPGKGVTKKDGKAMDGQITRILVKKQQVPVHEETKTKVDPHLKHWWIVFRLDSGEWMQVDMNLNDGYRIIWGVKEPNSELYRLKDVSVPDDLMTQDVVAAVDEFAGRETWYYNTAKPEERQQRYSCQDFVKRLMAELRIEKM
ncbi:MAG: hypothetical protein EOP35_00220 [Rubrivivax sp.]|nr:MAG: hypothetical protein EOP35_00220 [Rubrivivax sp.]